jgi:ribosomal protein S27E
VDDRVAAMNLVDFLDNGTTCPGCEAKATINDSEAQVFLGGGVGYHVSCPGCGVLFVVPITECDTSGTIRCPSLAEFQEHGGSCPMCGTTIMLSDARRSPQTRSQFFNAKCPRCKLPQVIICAFGNG